jgi:hypothetical protein
MAVETRGLREFIRAADAAGKQTKKVVRDRLRQVAKPVLEDAQDALAAYDARSASKLGISVRRAGSVSVEQRLKRTTGQHRQFGSLQMVEALIPALDANRSVIERGMERALDEIADTLERG